MTHGRQSARRRSRWRRRAARPPVSAMIRVLPIRIASRIWPIVVVDLVRAGMVQLVTLEPASAPMPSGAPTRRRVGQPFGVIERARPADIMFEPVVELGLERRIGLGGAIFAFEIEDQRISVFGDITGRRRPRNARGRRAASCRSLARSSLRRLKEGRRSCPYPWTPDCRSTPDETSTSDAPVRVIASPTLTGSSPPDSAQAGDGGRPSSRLQSKPQAHATRQGRTAGSCNRRGCDPAAPT